MKVLADAGNEPHVFILDINGEYSRAFPAAQETERKPDQIYLNGCEFGIPIWMFNAEEVCAWLSAAEQTQEPVLKDWWAIAKTGQQATAAATNRLQGALSSIDNLIGEISSLKKKSAPSYCDAVLSFLGETGVDTTAFENAFKSHRDADKYNTDVVANAAEIQTSALALGEAVRAAITGAQQGDKLARTADSPMFIPSASLRDPTLINRAVAKEDTFRVEAHLTTLKLRLRTRLDDRRWQSFLNYEICRNQYLQRRRLAWKIGLGQIDRTTSFGNRSFNA